MKREQVLLKPETINKIKKQAQDQHISKSAVIRQLVELGLDIIICKHGHDWDYQKGGVCECKRCGLKSRYGP